MFARDLTPFLDARQNQLQLEMAAGDGIDTKALGVLASDFAILLFVVQSSDINLHSVVTIVVVLLLTAALSLTTIAIWPRKYAGASTNMFDHPEYLLMQSTQLVKQLISDTEIAILTNKRVNRQRWLLCSCALILTLVASATLFLMLYFK